jgi:hypothetical protein
MHLRIDPVGRGRVVYFNYVGRGTPNDIRPDIILIRPTKTPVLKVFQLEGYSKFLHFHLPTKTKKSFRVVDEMTSPTAERC